MSQMDCVYIKWQWLKYAVEKSILYTHTFENSYQYSIESIFSISIVEAENENKLGL